MKLLSLKRRRGSIKRTSSDSLRSLNKSTKTLSASLKTNRSLFLNQQEGGSLSEGLLSMKRKKSTA
jgi:hypothetical protein